MSLYEIPNTWIWTKLGDVAEIIGGGTPRRSNKQYFQGDIPWATPTDVTALGGLWISSTGEYITEEALANSSAKILPAGTVLMTSRATIGITAITTRMMATNQGFANFICDDRILLNEYLAYYLSSIREWLIQIAGGTTFKEISKRVLATVDIPLPTILEQQRIVEILHQAEEIRSLRNQADKLSEEAIASIYQHWFSTPDQSWIKYKIGDIVKEIQTGKSISARSHPARQGQWGILKVSAVTSQKYRPEENKELPAGSVPLPENEVRRGDLLVSRANTSQYVGAAALVHDTPPLLLLPDKLWRLIIDEDKVNRYYLYMLLNSAIVRSEVSLRASGTSSSMKNISQKKYLDIDIALPPVEVQERFASYFKLVLGDVVANQQIASTSLRALLSMLSAGAFTGQLTDQWRSRNSSDIAEMTIERDILLGFRGEEPTIGDYEAGRVTQAEREEIERMLSESMKSLLESMAQNYSVVGESVQALQKQFAEQMAQIVKPIRIPMPEIQPIFTTAISDSLVRYQEQIASIAAMSRSVVENMAASMQPMTLQFNQLLESIASQIDAYPPRDHPRYDVASQLSRQQKFLFWVCDHQDTHFTVESIQEETELSTDVVRRALDLFASLGLVVPVSIPAQSSAGPIYTSAFRRADTEDEVRLVDLELLEEGQP